MITIGVLGRRWRASVTPWGAVQPWDGTPVLDWHIAADDRWHSPQHEAAVRQSRVDGSAVVETRVRIPDGDAVQRVFSIADGDGMTVIEIDNASPLPIAVAFTRGDLRTTRPAAAPIEGITLPPGSIAFPIGHHATLVVALPHTRDGEPAPLPRSLPGAHAVARGWVQMADRASRLVLPDPLVAPSIIAERCELALVGPAHPDDDPVGYLLGVAQLVRMGEPVDPWLADVADAVGKAARRATADWTLASALDAADLVFAAAGEQRARHDLAEVRRRCEASETLPATAPSGGVRLITWVERRLADHSGRLFPAGFADSWLGAGIEGYSLPTGPESAVSFALRWHGERPAVLWEQTGAARELTAPVVAPQWRSGDTTGEVLWPAPAPAPASLGPSSQSESFS